MPIRAYCTICSDFFDNSKDVAAIHCGHTFHYVCLLQWFQSAPSKTCPQCRKQVNRQHIINKLFFDIAPEDKDKEWRDKQKSVDTLKDTCESLQKDLDRVRKEIRDKEMLCSVLRKQMNFLESQKNERLAIMEEAKRLRVQVKILQEATKEKNKIKEDMKALQNDLSNADKEITSLKSGRCLKSPLSEIRPLAMKSKRRKVSRPVTSKPTSSLTTLDGFLE
ncbi:E3 ubiquitin-protein ligase TRAIP-like [Siphateles boraxobius]|uniref:E3 ubiquitin-protein ligase TRAIP-like n=1 Tax=Siphateles boraxobius TaxID=180520 RepID=UPI0040647990